MSPKTNTVVPQKLKRNERERKRVDQVNRGFNLLRERVPKTGSTKSKLSKVETLREAARYIEHLRRILSSTMQQPQPVPSYNYNVAPVNTQNNSPANSPNGENYIPPELAAFYQAQYANNQPQPQPQYFRNQPVNELSPGSSFYSDSSFGYEEQN